MTDNDKAVIAGVVFGIGVVAVVALLRCSQPAQQELPAEEPAQMVCVDIGERMMDCRLPDGARCVVRKSTGLSCDFSQAQSHLPPLPPCDISTLGLRAGPVQCIFDPHLGHRWAWKPLP